MAKQKSFFEIIKKIHLAAIGERQLRQSVNKLLDIPDIDDRVDTILTLFKKMKNKKSTDIYFYIMYDIENDKIRTHISKYLERSGCHRVQKSVFLAQLPRKQYQEIYKTIREVNQMYDNQDSIFLVPIGEDIINKMKMIGKNIDFEIVLNENNTFFI